jgi:hypothetical protein
MQRKTIAILLSLALVLVTVVPGLAQSTTKSLSTNFTLVNLGTSDAEGTIQYFEPDGSAWRSDVSFDLDANGGQGIYRQYEDSSLADGRGSVVVSASQPLGAVVQILARGQDPTSSGAYSGFESGDNSFYVPLAMRKLTTASGEGNSQIIVQNTGSGSTTANIELVNPDGTTRYTKSAGSIAAGASYLYDLEQESSSNVPDGWYGSAVVTAGSGGEVAVVSNLFSADAMQTFNAFGSSAPGTTWFVPLFTSRLANSLSTPIAVQNLSGGTIAANGVTVTCTPDPAIGGSGFTMKNSSSIVDTAAYYFNPVTDTSIPTAFYGSCTVDSGSANTVVFVQMRVVDTGEAAAYEAIKGGSTDTKVIVPLVAKRLGNGFATAVTIQNLNTSSAAHVNLTYNPSPEYVSAGGSATAVTITNQQIAAGGSMIQNHRVTSGAGSVSQLVGGWYGTLVVESSDQPIAAFVQLTFVTDMSGVSLPGGDNFMAHNGFTQ